MQADNISAVVLQHHTHACIVLRHFMRNHFTAQPQSTGQQGKGGTVQIHSIVLIWICLVLISLISLTLLQRDQRAAQQPVSYDASSAPLDRVQMPTEEARPAQENTRSDEQPHRGQFADMHIATPSQVYSLDIAGQVAFVDESTINLINADGTARVSLVNGSNPVLSPDGQRLAFDGNYTVLTANQDGSAIQTITRGHSPRWSPDGKRLVFVHSGLAVINADGTGQVRLCSGECRAPAWSPDGTTVAFASGDGRVYTVNADGSALRSLVEGHSPDWSPDGQRLVYIYDDDLYLVNADGSNPVLLLALPTTQSRPRWSPNGTQIAFLSEWKDTDADHNIHILSLSDRNWLAFDPGASLTRLHWSPDSQALIYEGYNDTEHGIYIAMADGSTLTRLADGQAPSWRP